MTHRWLKPSSCSTLKNAEAVVNAHSVVEPQFVYFFMDTTLKTKLLLSFLTLLLVVLMVFYGFVTLLHHFLCYSKDSVVSSVEGAGGGSIYFNAFVVLGISSLFCRFRD